MKKRKERKTCRKKINDIQKQQKTPKKSERKKHRKKEIKKNTLKELKDKRNENCKVNIKKK